MKENMNTTAKAQASNTALQSLCLFAATNDDFKIQETGVKATTEYVALLGIEKALIEAEKDWLPSTTASLDRIRAALRNLSRARE